MQFETYNDIKIAISKMLITLINILIYILNTTSVCTMQQVHLSYSYLNVSSQQLSTKTSILMHEKCFTHNMWLYYLSLLAQEMPGRRSCVYTQTLSFLRTVYENCGKLLHFLLKIHNQALISRCIDIYTSILFS